MEKFTPGRAVYTNNLTKEESEQWLKSLKSYTDRFVRDNFKWHVGKQMWPIKARIPGAADPAPQFIINHHTSNKERNYKPAAFRFLSSEMASANFLLGQGTDDLFYLVDIEDQSFHASARSIVPLSVRRALGVTSKWIKAPGIEVAGNGNFKLFTYSQFLNVIALQRNLVSFFGTIKQLKSHRFFSPIERSGDPGPLYFLPLVEHAVFNDINLFDENYWLEDYKKNPIKFANEGYKKWFDKYNLWDKDEWISKRRGLKVNSSFL